MKLFANSLVAALICGCATHPVAKTDSGTVHLVAVVKSIEPLSQTTPEMIVVDFDPRFALVLHINSASPVAGEFPPDVVFAIHSWSRLFARDWDRDVIGKQFEFAFSRAERHAHLQVLRRIE